MNLLNDDLSETYKECFTKSYNKTKDVINKENKAIEHIDNKSLLRKNSEKPLKEFLEEYYQKKKYEKLHSAGSKKQYTKQELYVKN